MELHDFINLVARKRKTIFGVIAIFILLGVVVIAVQNFKYSSKSQVLVVQEYDRTVDAYTASKSNEYLSNVLASVITTNSFYDKVMNSGFNIEASYFGATPKDRMKEWQRTVNAKSIGDSGIISITVYHPNRDEAERIVRAVNYVLMTQHTAYSGASDAVKIRLIDQPITSNFPVKPNIPLILGLAVGLGLVSGLLIIYLSAANNYQQIDHIVKNNIKSTNYLAQANSNHNHIDEHQVNPHLQNHLSKVHTPYGNRAAVQVNHTSRPEPELDNNFVADEFIDSNNEDIPLRGNIRNILN